MVAIGDTVSNRDLVLVTDDGMHPTDLDGVLEGRSSVALAFFPAAFSSVCTTELCTFRDALVAGPAAGRVVGVSVDSPYVLRAYRDEHDLVQPLASDFNRTLTRDLGLDIAFEALGLEGLAQRAVVCVDEARTVTYAWVADHPGQEPPYDEVLDHLGLPGAA
ncbi:MAG: redoxin domain-containing protein [Halobacteriales archaeon]